MKCSTVSSFPELALGIMLATGSAVCAQAPDSHQNHERACSNRTLSGDYGVKVEGTHSDIIVRTLALFGFDGQGGLTSRAYAVVNGTPPPDWVDGTGSYTVNSDCTGTLALDFPPIQFHIVVTDGGSHVYLVTDGDAITGEARKVQPTSGHDRCDSYQTGR